jgi:hypothetical protein
MPNTEKKTSFLDSMSDLMTKVEHLFTEDKPEIESTTQKFMDYKLATGEIVRTDTEEVGVGTAITIIAEDGTEAPLTDGTYQLVIDEANVIEVVVVAGLVESATPKEVEAPVEEEAKTEDAPESTDLEADPKVAELEAKVTALESKVNEIVTAMNMNAEALNHANAKYEEVNAKYTDIAGKYVDVENNYKIAQSSIEKLSTEKTQLKSLFEQMFELMKEIGNTSQAEPTSPPKEKQFRKVEPMVSRIDRLQAEAVAHMNKIKETK